jgi:hypothetical protein
MEQETHGEPRGSGAKTFTWSIFVLIAAAAVFIAAGLPSGPIAVFALAAALIFAFTYPYAAYGALVMLIPFMGITVSIPAGALPWGERAFGGSIDIYAGEVAAMVLLAAWALKIIFLWVKRHDVNWKPWLPLLVPALGIAAAHMLSAFSPFRPDALLVIKYAIRPVFWSYLVYVLLTVNMVRSRRRLKMALGVAAATGAFAAFTGFASFGFSDPGQIIPRARPLPMFGMQPLGENHNLLAEWLSFTAMATLALISLVRSARSRRLLALLAGFQAVIALLTFARSLWIVMALQAVLLAAFVWREELKRYASIALIAVLFLLPLGALMASFSSAAVVQSSTSSRWMLTEIALNAWSQSPFIGAGAGTFVSIVERTAVFFIEYGNPMDAHGWIQKLLAETGLIGLAAAAWFLIETGRFVRRALKGFPPGSPERTVMLILCAAAAGAVAYQLFNTNYWSGKLWFPIGILIASSRALKSREAGRR